MGWLRKKDASKLEVEERKIDGGEVLNIKCAPGGGFVGILSNK